MRQVMFGLVSGLAIGCNEYDLKDPLDADLPGTAAGGTTTGGGDGAGTDPDTTGAGGGDGAGGPGTGTLEDDGCYAPQFGFETSPAARLVTTDAVTPITVTLVLSDSGYDNRLVIDAPIVADLVDSWSEPVGTTLDLGPYAEGTELVFAIHVTDNGDHWQSGPESRNPDGVAHVAVTYEGDCSWLMGFEDLWGGGDLDYNDVVFRVQGMLVEE